MTDKNDKILIRKIRLKSGIKIKAGDIITLDMIEPYESEAVRKVAEYIRDNLYKNLDTILFTEHAQKIVDLVHEAEDADD